MKTCLKRSLVLVIITLVRFAGASAGLAGEPLELVRSVSERAIAVLKDPALKAADKKPERVGQLKAIINPVFDYEEMARRTLDAQWRRRTAAEQQEFVKLLRAFLEKIYSEKADLYEGERVVLGRETVDQDFAEVESKVINAKGEASPVIYRLKRHDGSWKIYDAVVENISIVNNYRSQFDRVISKSSYDDLKKMLREKGG